MKPDPMGDVSRALHLLHKIIGEYTWFVRKSADDVLRMDFGAPHLRVREPALPASNRSQSAIDALERRIVIPTGQWHLFIEDAEWSVSTKFYSTSRGDPDAVGASAALRQLDGQKLAAVRYIAGSGNWCLEFDLGGCLTMAPSAAGDPDWPSESQWILFFQDGSNASFTNSKLLVQNS